MDRRFILQGLECQASIGIYDAERANTQRIKIDAEVRLYPATEPVDDKVDSTWMMCNRFEFEQPNPMPMMIVKPSPIS